MAKSRERSEVELLRAENKRLTKQVKELQRTLGRLQKRSHRVEELEEIFQDLEFDTVEKYSPKTNKCPECLEGSLEDIDLGVRKMTKCTKCTYRKSNKK